MIDITKLSPADLERFIHMQAIVDRQDAAAAKIRAYRAYYDGEHPVLLTKRQKEFLGGLTDNAEFTFAHNIIRSVIDTLRERLSISSVTCSNEAPADGGEATGLVSEAFWDWWIQSRMDSQQIRLYRRALRDGFAYVIVAPDEDGKPAFTIHKVDAGPQDPGVCLHRDPEDESRVLFATRYFYNFDPLTPGKTGIERKTVYLPGEIRKYIRDSDRLGTWKPYKEPGDAGWPIPWVDSRGEPLGVTVIEFANPGGSEIDQIIGLQNGLNKAWLDLIAAADMSGFPIPFVAYNDTGTPFDSSESDADDQGKDEVRLSPGRLLEVHDGTVGRLDAANLAPMIEVLWTFVQAMSGVSRTPAYYLRPVGGGEVPSGEALKQLESGLVRRAQERQLIFGQAWEEVFEIAYRINQTYGKSLPDVDELDVDLTWEDANVRNEQVIAQTATAHKALEVPNPVVWEMLGYSPTDIARWETMKAAEDAAKIAQVTAAVMQAGVNQSIDQQLNQPATQAAAPGQAAVAPIGGQP